MPALGIGFDPWMQGGIWPYPTVLAGEAFADINGVTITVGSTVKFVGVVTALNQDQHYGSVQVTGLHPNGVINIYQPGSGSPRSLFYPTPNPQNLGVVKAFEPLQLVVGS